MSREALPILSSHTEELPVKLNEDEIRERGIRLAQLEGDLATHALTEKEKKSELNARKKEIEAKIAHLAAVVRNGHESREIWVDACLDGNMVVEIRQDTQTAVRQRPMRDEERQAKLFEPEAEAEEPGDGGPN